MEIITIRKAQPKDIPGIGDLIHCSARALASAFYPFEQIEAALEAAWGVDSQLISDGTYYLAEVDGALAGCGGWSWRATLFGGNNQSGRSSAILDPRIDPARIRAFFVHPNWVRKGVGKKLFEICELNAIEAGFQSFQLVATFSGKEFYESLGFHADTRKMYPLKDGLEIEFVTMSKYLVTK